MIPALLTLLAVLAAPADGGDAIRLGEGESLSGVTRHGVDPLMPGRENASPTLAVAPDGSVWVAFVVYEKERERIYVRRASRAGAKLGPPRLVSTGRLAWQPRLATGGDGKVWLTWSGRQTEPKRGDHGRDVFLRRVSGKRPGAIINVSGSRFRSGAPDLAVGPDGTVQLFWEEGTGADEVRITYRAYRPDGAPVTGPQAMTQGVIARRPSALAIGDSVYVAWDVLATPGPVGTEDPDYDVAIATRKGDRIVDVRVLDARDGIQAAPDLAPAPGGGVLIAYHSSHRHGLVKWWELRRLRGDAIEALSAHRPAAERTPAGEQQGAEFPALAVTGGRVLVFTRPSQGAYLQAAGAGGVSAPLDLTRRGWGARGARTQAAAAPDGSVLMVRRARHESVLERFTFEGRGTLPEFAGVNDPPKPVRTTLTNDAVDAGDGRRVFFGDVHMHSAMTDATGPPDEIYARAWARGLHFAALTDHDNIVGSRLFPSKHDEIAWVTDTFDAKEGFSTLHAYEWTTPPVPKGSGHRNVYFRGSPPPRICGYRDGCPDTKRLFAKLRSERAIAVPHHTSWTGTEWDLADESIQRHFEIVSTHGACEHLGNLPIKHRGEMAGMFARDGLARGLKFGLLGGSDAHGLLWHHGIGGKRDSWRSGLTGVLAKSDRRADLFDAIHARRTFATSGARMHVRLVAGGTPMGQAGRTKRPVEVRYVVTGTRPLTEVVVVRDGEEVHRIATQGTSAKGVWVDAIAGPGDHTYYLRAVETSGQDTDVAWTSPVFLKVE